jgi:hypothetical protein
LTRSEGDLALRKRVISFVSRIVFHAGKHSLVVGEGIECSTEINVELISFTNENAERGKEKLTDVPLLDQFVQLLDGSTDEEERRNRKDMHRLAKETRAGTSGTRREIHRKGFRERRRSNHSRVEGVKGDDAHGKRRAYWRH